jgi:hypothetical protein
MRITDERCFLPIHIYEAGSGKPVAVILRAGKTPGGVEVRTILKHVIARIRRHWPKVDILVRGDSHYARPKAMAWCDENGVDYVFGLAGNDVLHAKVGLLPTISACAAPRLARKSTGPGPSSATPPKAGPSRAASWPVSKPLPRASMRAIPESRQSRVRVTRLRSRPHMHV